jgi:hypothetical protein
MHFIRCQQTAWSPTYRVFCDEWDSSFRSIVERCNRWLG